MKTMNKILQILRETVHTDVIRFIHCLIDSRNIQKVFDKKNHFKSYDKLVNAGGFDVKGVYSIPCDLSFMEVQSFWEGGAISQNLVRYAIATSTPALTIF